MARNGAQDVSDFWVCSQLNPCSLPDSPKVITLPQSDTHFFWVPGVIFSALGMLNCLIFRIILEGDIIIIFLLLTKKPRFRNINYWMGKENTAGIRARIMKCRNPDCALNHCDTPFKTIALLRFNLYPTKFSVLKVTFGIFTELGSHHVAPFLQWLVSVPGTLSINIFAGDIFAATLFTSSIFAA